MQEVASEIRKMQKMASEDAEHARSGFGDSEYAKNGVGRNGLLIYTVNSAPLSLLPAVVP